MLRKHKVNLSGIIAGGENNTVQLDAHNSATFGISNNNNSENSVVAGSHNTITNANNSIAGGFGNYKNKTATAIGAFYQPNENILLSLGTTLGTNNNIVNGGATFKFGKHSNKQVATDTKVQNLEQRLTEMEAKYNELLAKIESK